MEQREKRSKSEIALHDIYDSITTLYKQKVAEWFPVLAEEKATQADVIILIMNLSLSLGTFPIELIHIIMPNQDIDYEYIKVALVNQFASKFEEIKEKSSKPIPKEDKPRIILPN